MGKKKLRFEPDAKESEAIAAEEEYEAELQAVQAIRAERESEEIDKTNHDSNNDSNSKASSKYNREAMESLLQNMDTAALPFVENYSVSASHALILENELDDIEREMSFYNHTLAAVQVGFEQLKALNVPIFRPTDFFCEQVKSDAHMTRIKDRLIIEEKKMDAFEKRKNREETRKFNKQVSDLKKQERTSSEHKMIKDVEHLRKSAAAPNKKRKRGDEGTTEEKLEKILSSHDNRRGKDGDRDRPEKSKKRQAMDKKYGINGRERKRAKMNDKKSLNDMTDFNPRGGKFVRRERVSGGKKKPNRPGKEARQKSRSSRRS